MSPSLAGNNHVNLTVSDLARSTDWYCRVFGLTIVSNDENIGLQVPEANDLPRWAQHLDDLGIAHSGVVHSPYADVISFRDPDGIALELSWRNLDSWVPLVGRVANAG